MKTTIDIPEPLYRKAKIRAVETGTTLKEIVLTSLSKEIENGKKPLEPGPSFMERRKASPEFAKLEAEGAFAPTSSDRDITTLISDDRDGH